MKVRYSEIFTSIQGEGIHQGQPSTFVRLYGCNFTCAGFSAGKGDIVNKPADGVTAIDQLDGNSFKVGCDSRYAWAPEFKHLQTMTTAQGLADDILAHLAEYHLRDQNVDHIVWTGGEPLMHQNVLAKIIPMLPFRHVTFETNCSITLTPAFVMALVEWLAADRRRTVLFSNSPKLAHSGEPAEKRIRPDAAASQRAVAAMMVHHGMEPRASLQTFKYVVGEDEHFVEARDLHYALCGFDTEMQWATARSINPPMAMPLGATIEQYREVAPLIAELCLDHGFRFAARGHLELFGNRVGT